MIDYRARMRQSEELLERMQESDRVRARRKQSADPASLTAYERELLGLDATPAVRPAPAEGSREVLAAKIRPKGLIFRSGYLAALCDHAVELAWNHGIRFEVRTPDGHAFAFANFDTKTIYAPAVTSEETYAAFLHELGHLIDPEGDSRQYRYVIDKSIVAPLGEMGAWRFAVKTARPHWTLAMQEKMAGSLSAVAPDATPEERAALGEFIRWAATAVKDRPYEPKRLAGHIEKVLSPGSRD